MSFDVAIVGGGPSGSTVGSLLKKYHSELNVVILEREVFPRDHVGESQLPPISYILEEMGCWYEVEAANFPIKIGATYKWGKSPELWDFEFLPANTFKEEPRPAKFEGQRRATAFQVDRAIYDKILLDHAQNLGCDVRMPARVVEILREGDRINGLRTDSGEVITAKYYIDGSGHSGLIRRAMGVQSQYPTSLQNIAIWDYFQNAEWAVRIGVGGTRVQVISIGYGWIWFIPLGPTRTSVGLIVPASYYKERGLRPEDLYQEALKKDPMIAGLMKAAVSEGNLQSTKDWSFIAERHCGENWFLVGESGGFADPILAAGLTMAHSAGREAAFTILELLKGKTNSNWLREQFDQRQAGRIRSHIRFADYWYTANSQFEDLKEFTSVIAQEAGLELEPEKAWAWLAQGGFIDEDLLIGTGGYALETIRNLSTFLTDLKQFSPLDQNNVFKLDISGATWKERAMFHKGRVTKDPCYCRGSRVLPIRGPFEFWIDVLQQAYKVTDMMDLVGKMVEARRSEPRFMEDVVYWLPSAMEAMISDGWVKASYDANVPLVPAGAGLPDVHWNEDNPKFN